jgi:hypothetical protein
MNSSRDKTTLIVTTLIAETKHITLTVIVGTIRQLEIKIMKIIFSSRPES